MMFCKDIINKETIVNLLFLTPGSMIRVLVDIPLMRTDTKEGEVEQAISKNAISGC